MTKLIVFMGFHKTGSSTLREYLQNSDCFYIGKPFDKFPVLSILINLITDKEKFPIECIVENKVNVISEERLSSIQYVKNLEHVSVKSHVEDIVNFFRQSNCDVKYVLIKRDAKTFLESRYAENPQIFQRMGIRSFKDLGFQLRNAIYDPEHRFRSLLENFDMQLWNEELSLRLGNKNLLILDYDELKFNEASFVTKLQDFCGFTFKTAGVKPQRVSNTFMNARIHKNIKHNAIIIFLRKALPSVLLKSFVFKSLKLVLLRVQTLSDSAVASDKNFKKVIEYLQGHRE